MKTRAEGQVACCVLGRKCLFWGGVGLVGWWAWWVCGPGGGVDGGGEQDGAGGAGWGRFGPGGWGRVG